MSVGVHGMEQCCALCLDCAGHRPVTLSGGNGSSVTEPWLEPGGECNTNYFTMGYMQISPALNLSTGERSTELPCFFPQNDKKSFCSFGAKCAEYSVGEQQTVLTDTKKLPGVRGKEAVRAECVGTSLTAFGMLSLTRKVGDTDGATEARHRREGRQGAGASEGRGSSVGV